MSGGCCVWWHELAYSGLRPVTRQQDKDDASCESRTSAALQPLGRKVCKGGRYMYIDPQAPLSAVLPRGQQTYPLGTLGRQPHT